VKFLILSLNLITTIALAQSEFDRPAIWQKVLTCEGGAAVVDVDTQDRGPFHTGLTKQIVVRNSNIVDYFRSRGLTVNSANEVIATVHGDINNLQAFIEGGHHGDDLRINFYRDGSGFKLMFTGIVQGYVDGDGQFHSARYYEIANWYFNNCN
jgi:hypothetical protein